MGRFHYWLGTSQVTKFELVFHRLPFFLFIWASASPFLHRIQCQNNRI